ncbi:MAG: UvrD-helicase domain-containing protein [Bacteroidales bacterium]|nr:UvrD-helicase domain-containing protein [Bacteroidales bacterium]
MTIEQLRQIIYKRLNITVNDDNIDRLTLEQMEFITHDINIPCYLEACPGSGKTEVVGIKAAYELIDWKSNFSGFAIVSFTNNASNEIEKRAKKYAGANATSHPHFIGTLDSFFYKYILCPFVHGLVGFKGKNGDCSPRAIIDEKSNADFLNNNKYHPKTSYAVVNKDPKPGAHAYRGIPISANRFYFDAKKNDFIVLPPIDNVRVFSTLSEILNRPEQRAFLRPWIETWLTQEKITEGFWIAKRAFWADGFLTFETVNF